MSNENAPNRQLINDGYVPRIRWQDWVKTHKLQTAGLLVIALIVVVSILMAITSFGLSVHTTSNTIFAIYERVGSDECPQVDGTTLLYKGITAGFSTGASSTTFKCLPIGKEQISYYNDANSKFNNESEIRHIHAAVYRSFLDGGAFNNYEAFCAVCQVQGRDTIEVLPSTDKCTDSWTKEYEGYLMTDNMATTFVCVDTSLEKVPNTYRADTNAQSLRHVVVPSDFGFPADYDASKVLSCVVCSK